MGARLRSPIHPFLSLTHGLLTLPPTETRYSVYRLHRLKMMPASRVSHSSTLGSDWLHAIDTKSFTLRCFGKGLRRRVDARWFQPTSPKTSPRTTQYEPRVSLQFPLDVIACLTHDRLRLVRSLCSVVRPSLAEPEGSWFVRLRRVDGYMRP